jgi:hypothetical protein
LFFIIRVAAGVGGAIVGWFLAGPVTRLLYRSAFHRPVPNWLLPWTKMAGALLLGFLLFYFLPLGGGLGWGWGPGEGGGPGLGPGPGGGPGSGTDGKEKKGGKDGSADKQQSEETVRQRVEIELIGPLDPRFKHDHYYLLKRAEPAINLSEVESHFKKDQDKIEVHVILTDKSPGRGQGALGRLIELTSQYRIPIVVPPEKP